MSGTGLVSVLVAALASVSSVHMDGGCVLVGQLMDGSIRDEQVKAKTNKQQACWGRHDSNVVRTGQD
jgi:hypothetical protein